jgi:hypothetical protein
MLDVLPEVPLSFLPFNVRFLSVSPFFVMAISGRGQYDHGDGESCQRSYRLIQLLFCLG